MIDLTAAAGIFCSESHQIAAFNAVWLLLTPEQREEFSDTFTAGPPLRPCPTMALLLQRHQQTMMEAQ